MKEQPGRLIAGHIYVRPTVVVEIGGCHSQAEAGARFEDARAFGQVCECAVAVVVVEDVMRPAGHAARTPPPGPSTRRTGLPRVWESWPDPGQRSWPRTDRATHRDRSLRTNNRRRIALR